MLRRGIMRLFSPSSNNCPPMAEGGLLVVGLGNPGKPYEHTRHNAGFDTLEILADDMGARLQKIKCQSVLAETRCADQRVVLAKPQTYMNDSGRAVRDLLSWYRVMPENMLVIYDDIDLPAGHLRMRKGGSAGTHNGMRSIIACVGRDDFPRLRVGIGRPAQMGYDLKDYVLGRYAPEERAAMFDAMRKAAQAARLWMQEGQERAITFANTHNPSKE